MTPIMVSLLKAKMRLAFTRACRNFPRIDSRPITSAVYEVYAYEAYSQGNTFTLANIPLADEVDNLTGTAVRQLLSTDEFGRMSYGLSTEDAKLAKRYCRGLGYSLGIQMLNFARGNMKDTYGALNRRRLMLESRRNQLANNFVDRVMENAGDRIRNADRGWVPYA